MPAIDGAYVASESRPYSVLVTGFGPFGHHIVNPSWLAVQPLHDTVIPVTDPRREIQITALEVPVTYDDVLSIVPGLHARPPVLPPTDHTFSPPPNGYDLVLHVGVAGSGPLLIEKRAHKLGYHSRDAQGRLAPLVPGTAPPQRGFGEGYEAFGEMLYTDVDVDTLVHHLYTSGVEQVTSSLDPGRYLCDFIYYCSLAESRRSVPGTTKVLFIHCPPVDQPLSTEQVTEALKKSTVWLCARPAS